MTGFHRFARRWAAAGVLTTAIVVPASAATSWAAPAGGVQPADAAATTTTLSTPGSSPIDSIDQFEVTVAPTGGSGTPDGTVTVTDESTTVPADADICSADLQNGSATCYGFFGPIAGDHTLVATYTPTSTSSFAGSTSQATDVTVEKGDAGVADGGGHPSSDCYFARCPFGFDLLFDGGYPNPTVEPSGPFVWTVNGHRTRYCDSGGCNFPHGLSTGKHHFVMHYAGDANYNPLTFDYETVTIRQSPVHVALTVRHPSVGRHGRLGLHVEVQSTAGDYPAQGRVRLTVSRGRMAAPLRRTVSLRRDGTARWSLPAASLAPGKHRIRAIFQSDRNFASGRAGASTTIR